MRRSLRRAGIALALSLATTAPAVASGSASGEERKLFITSAQENTTTDQATLRVHRAIDADDERASYVVTESSNKKDAKARGVNYSPKLAHARAAPRHAPSRGPAALCEIHRIPAGPRCHTGGCASLMISLLASISPVASSIVRITYWRGPASFRAARKAMRLASGDHENL